jgi:hypothetical protein
MNFNNWRLWVRSKPWSLKWFVFLVLIRPIIDNFFYLKDISPILSPLFWAGALTPVLSLGPILRRTYYHNTLHRLFNVWSALIILNIVFLIFQPIEFVSQIQWILKLSLPVYLFAFLRVFIRNKSDFIGLITTFLYSCGIAALMLLYELVFHPIRIEYSRGIERMQGGYADVMNYAIYLSFGFLLLSFFYISFKLTHKGLKISLPLFIILGIFCIVGYIAISHTVSYFVFASLLVLFVTSLARKYTFITFVVIIFFGLGLSFYGDKLYQERINPLVEKELEVIQGKRNESQLFHGRMSRWQYGWKNFKNAPVTAWLFGYPTSLEDPFFNISIGIHNDYLRIFYFTGIFGLLVYLLFLFNLWRRKKFISLNEKFILHGSLVILLLYCVSTTPTFYPNFLYILFSIFVYFSLPPSVLMHHGEIQSTNSR